MLDPQSWLHHAQSLSLGQRRRFDHDCGPGRTLIAKHGEEGFDAYCWRCSESGFVPHPRPSLGERLARLNRIRAAEHDAEQTIRPPMPAEFDPRAWPLRARVWLYKAGLSNDRIREIGAYYCDRLDRVVLPVMSDGKLVYWQARGFDPELPKYLNPSIDKSKLVACYGSGPRLVLTEDILSAARVGDCGTAWSLLGTSISDAVACQAKAHVGPEGSVFVWLDPDAAGRRGAIKCADKLRLLGLDVRIIHSERDPKYYSKQEIEKFLT